MLKKRELKAEIVAFQDYIKTYRWFLFIFNALLLLIWMPWMTRNNLRIDMDILINNPYSTGGWESIGRQGALLTKNLFGLSWFNPIFASIFGYMMICLASILFGYLFWRVSYRKAVICTAFGLIVFTAPIMAEQFYFTLQIFEIAWAYVLCVMAAALSYDAILKKKVISGIVAIGAMIWIFSTYQSFVVLYIVVVAAVYVLLYQRNTMEGIEISYLKTVGGLTAMFMVAFVINTVVTNVFFSSGSYLDSQILWKTLPEEQCVRNIIIHIKQGFFGEGTFFTPLYGVIAFLSVVAVIFRCIRKCAKAGWLTVLAVAALQIAPFLLTVLMGAVPVVRAQLVYPMVLGINILILFHYIPKNKVTEFLVVLLTFILFWTQTLTTERLIYTDNICSQEGLRLAEAIERRVSEVSDANKPIAIIGLHFDRLNEACISGEIIGYSVYNWDLHLSPQYLERTRNICDITRVYGFSFLAANEEQMLEARKAALEMPSWPAKGSVKDAGEVIVVKLSEDDWTEELIEPSVTKYTAQELAPLIVSEAELWAAVEYIKTENEILDMGGWICKENTDSQAVEMGIFLYDKKEDSFCHITTYKKNRNDVADVFGSSLYAFSGFHTMVSLEMLDKSLEEYDVYVGIKQNGQWQIRMEEADLINVQ